MPKIRPGMKRPPAGFELISDKLEEYDEEMRLALSDDPSLSGHPAGKGNRKGGHVAVDGDSGATACGGRTVGASVPPLWRVARINRERTRYVFNVCCREKTVSDEVLQYCCKMNFVDSGLVRRWAIPGYERLCCTACCVPGTASAAARMVGKYARRDKSEQRGSVGHEREGTCVCRVPVEMRRAQRFNGCAVCGCTGCGSGESRPRDSVGGTRDGAPAQQDLQN